MKAHIKVLTQRDRQRERFVQHLFNANRSVGDLYVLIPWQRTYWLDSIIRFIPNPIRNIIGNDWEERRKDPPADWITDWTFGWTLGLMLILSLTVLFVYFREEFTVSELCKHSLKLSKTVTDEFQQSRDLGKLGKLSFLFFCCSVHISPPSKMLSPIYSLGGSMVLIDFWVLDPNEV